MSLSMSSFCPRPARSSRRIETSTREPTRQGLHLSAGFVSVKLRHADGNGGNVGIVVHHDNAARPQHRTSLFAGIVVEFQPRCLVGRQDGGGYSADDHGLEASVHASGGLDDRLQRRTEWIFVNAGALHVTGDAEDFRAGVAGGPDFLERLRTGRNNPRHTGEHLDVVDDCRASVGALDSGEREFKAGVAALALDRLEPQAARASTVDSVNCPSAVVRPGVMPSNSTDFSRTLSAPNMPQQYCALGRASSPAAVGNEGVSYRHCDQVPFIHPFPISPHRLSAPVFLPRGQGHHW